jgi:hypothetical protein
MNTFAIASLATGAGYFVVGIGFGLTGRTLPLWFVALPALAVVFGYFARRQIEDNPQRGKLIASAGVSLGFIGLALFALGAALVLLTSH